MYGAAVTADGGAAILTMEREERSPVLAGH
jgi:hypothetical protein